MFRTAMLIVADPDAGEAGPDRALRVVRDTLARGPFVEVDFYRVPDEQALIRARLRLWSDRDGVDLLLTCGGIGLGRRERTPEATREVIERDVPGMAERMRAAGSRHTPLAAVWRGLVGIRRGTLVVNLPGDADAAGVALRALLPVLPGALAATGGASDGDERRSDHPA